jgi:hypothetical protein
MIATRHMKNDATFTAYVGIGVVTVFKLVFEPTYIREKIMPNVGTWQILSRLKVSI